MADHTTTCHAKTKSATAPRRGHVPRHILATSSPASKTAVEPGKGMTLTLVATEAHLLPQPVSDLTSCRGELGGVGSARARDPHLDLCRHPARPAPQDHHSIA